jgi:hypothetical protein
MLLFIVGDLFGHVRKRLPWADPKIVKVSAYLFSNEFIVMSVSLVEVLLIYKKELITVVESSL